MYTPLHAACASGQISVVRQLLDLGVEVDAVSGHGNTSLHIACLNGQDMAASELIAHGASINAANQRGQVRGAQPDWHITALLPACLYLFKTRFVSGRALVILTFRPFRFYISSKSSQNFRSLLITRTVPSLVPSMQTPLHCAAASTHGAMCLEILVNERANVNAKVYCLNIVI